MLKFKTHGCTGAALPDNQSTFIFNFWSSLKIQDNWLPCTTSLDSVCSSFNKFLFSELKHTQHNRYHSWFCLLQCCHTILIRIWIPSKLLCKVHRDKHTLHICYLSMLMHEGWRLMHLMRSMEGQGNWYSMSPIPESSVFFYLLYLLYSICVCDFVFVVCPLTWTSCKPGCTSVLDYG